MYRTRIERLEERKMFSVTDLIIDPFGAQSASPAAVDEPPAIVDSPIGPADGLIVPGPHLRASATIAAGPSNLIIVVCNRDLNGSNLLPYVEQDNVYKLSDAGRDTEAPSFVAALYADVRGRPLNSSAIASITDGSSNTLLFNATAVNVPPIDLDLLGARAEISSTNLSVVSLDTWEHAYALQSEPTTNGIIAVLIGLAADPADTTGNTALRADVASMDGSAKLIASNVTRTAPLGALRPSLLASDEYFALLSNTMLDAAPYHGRPNC